MTSKKCYTYMVRCSDGTFYTGIAFDVEQRLRQHNGEISGGAKYTRVRRPVQLVYAEEFTSFSEADKRERSIKKLKRKQKLELIKSIKI